jgi:hypothetical protein
MFMLQCHRIHINALYGVMAAMLETSVMAQS